MAAAAGSGRLTFAVLVGPEAGPNLEAYGPRGPCSLLDQLFGKSGVLGIHLTAGAAPLPTSSVEVLGARPVQGDHRGICRLGLT